MLQHDFGNRLTALPLEATTPFLRLSRLLLSRSGVSPNLLQHCQPQQELLYALLTNNCLKVHHNLYWSHKNQNVLFRNKREFHWLLQITYYFWRNSNWPWYDVIKDILGGGYTPTFGELGEKELIVNTSGNIKVTMSRVAEVTFCCENFQLLILRKLWGILLRSLKASQPLPP